MFGGTESEYGCPVNHLVWLYRVLQEESVIHLDSVPWVKLHQYDEKYSYLNLNRYGDNDRTIFGE